MNLGPWHIEDFESLSWHDVCVYGFHFDTLNPDEGTADLVLDIDYILKWDNVEGAFQFTVCPAELKFHEVFGLKFELDYSTPSAGMCPFSIDGITRKLLEFSTGARSFHWHIPINWPRGSLNFDAPAFTQTLIGNPVVQSQQWISAIRRSSRTPT